MHAISLGVEAIPGVEMISAETGGTGIFAPAVSDSSNTMLQSLSDAFLSQFHSDEGQALTIVSGQLIKYYSLIYYRLESIEYEHAACMLS